jgi:hypothetical protein
MAKSEDADYDCSTISAVLLACADSTGGLVSCSGVTHRGYRLTPARLLAHQDWLDGHLTFLPKVCRQSVNQSSTQLDA